MDNIEKIQKELIENIKGVKNGSRTIQEAESINNSIGKLRDVLMVRLRYSHLREEKPSINFLDINKKNLLKDSD